MPCFLSNFKLLHQDMISKNETRTVFPYQFLNKGFSCIFIAENPPYGLYITSLGKTPFTIEKEVNKNYTINAYLADDLKKLREYLELKHNEKNPFSPNAFFDHFNTKIPSIFSQSPDYKQVLIAASNCGNIEEADKIYFCGWRINPENAKVSEANYKKTKLAFGEKMAKNRRNLNISSKWSDNPDEEALLEINKKF